MIELSGLITILQLRGLDVCGAGLPFLKQCCNQVRLCDDANDTVVCMNAYGFGEIRISWDRAKIPLTGKQAAERLKNGQPRIVYYDDDEGGVLQTRTMHEGEEILAARRLRQFFRDEAPLRA